MDSILNSVISATCRIPSPRHWHLTTSRSIPKEKIPLKEALPLRRIRIPPRRGRRHQPFLLHPSLRQGQPHTHHALPQTVPPLAWCAVMAAWSGHPHGMRPRSGARHHPEGDRTRRPLGVRAWRGRRKNADELGTRGTTL